MPKNKTLEQLIREAQLENRSAVEEIVNRFQPLVWGHSPALGVLFGSGG